MTLRPIPCAARVYGASPEAHRFGLPWTSADYILSCLRAVIRRGVEL